MKAPTRVIWPALLHGRRAHMTPTAHRLPSVPDGRTTATAAMPGFSQCRNAATLQFRSLAVLQFRRFHKALQMLSITDLLGRQHEEAIALLGPAWNDPQGDKEQEPDQRVYLEFREKGVSLILNEAATIFCIQLYGEDFSENFACFQGSLPGGLTLSSSRAEVRAALGQPLRCAEGAAGKGLFGRYGYAWDKYAIASCEFHFEYNEALDHLMLISIEQRLSS